MTKDHEIIDKLFNHISTKLDWESKDNWTNYHFSKLSDIIFKDVNVLISTDTLKRIVGKRSSLKPYNPHAETKNALAKFIGYSNWGEFEQNTESELKIHPTSSTSSIINEDNLSKKVYLGQYFFIVLIIIIGLFGLVYYYFNTLIIGNISLEYDRKNTPMMIKAQYIIDKRFNNDSVWIDFGYNQQLNVNQDRVPIYLENLKGSLYHSYLIPGLFIVKLKTSKSTLDSEVVIVPSKGWESFIKNPYVSYTNLPKSENEKLFCSEIDRAEWGLQPHDDYCIEHINMGNFSFDGDNFDAEIKFKTGISTGSIACFDFKLLFHGNQGNPILLSFLEEGCNQFQNLQVSDIVKYGSKDNTLHELSIRPDSSYILNISNHNKKMIIELNKKKKYEIDYNLPIKNIVGIKLNTKGRGEIYYMKVWQNNQLKINEEFMQESSM